MDCSPPGSSVHGILQARTLEWVAIPFSRDLPDPGIEPGSPALHADSLPTDPLGKPTSESNPSTFHFHALEKEMATHSNVLAWRIPGMGEPGGLPSMGSHRVGHDWSDLAAAAAARFIWASLVAPTGKESACNAGDLGSMPGWGRFLGEGHGNPLQ